MKQVSMIALAAVVSVFATGCSSLCGESTYEAPVKCMTAKGGSMPSHAGKGRGAHEDHGWTYMTRSECMAAGGRVVE